MVKWCRGNVITRSTTDCQFMKTKAAHVSKIN